MTDIDNALLNKSIKELESAGVDINDARIEVMDFFEAASDMSQFDSFVLRRAQGEPAAYIIGNKPFYKSEYKVRPGVLIPRSDTELLVESALKYLGCNFFPMGDVINVPSCPMRFKGDDINIIDLCSGTGCVGLSIYDELLDRGKDLKLTLVDISDDAISCSQENSSEKSGVEVIKLDVLNINKVTDSFSRKPIHMILSNPPYIDKKDMLELDDVVKNYEPELALYGGEDGLVFYYALAQEAVNLLVNDGALFVEHGYNQGEAVRSIFEQAGLKKVATLKDYGGNDRVTFGIKKN